MAKKRTLIILIAVLVAEAAAVMAFPARTPRPARVLTAATTLMLAAALWLMSRGGTPRGRD